MCDAVHLKCRAKATEQQQTRLLVCVEKHFPPLSLISLLLTMRRLHNLKQRARAGTNGGRHVQLPTLAEWASFGTRS